MRGAVVLIENIAVALIERIRAGRTYYLFPGGTVEPGETIEQATLREIREELGLDICLGPLLAVVTFDSNQQHYFAAETIGGVFGTGYGIEYASPPESDDGSYRPVWIPVREMGDYDIRPAALAEAVRTGDVFTSKQVLYIQE